MHERARVQRSLPFRGAAVVLITLFGPCLGTGAAAPPQPFAGRTVLLDFYASWCGPCRDMVPTVTELERLGYPVQRIDVDRERDLAERFGVHSLPTFIMLVDGREAGRLVGGQSLATLTELCRRAPRTASPVSPAEAESPPPGPTVAQAEPAVGGGSSPDPRSDSALGTGNLPGLTEGVRYAAATEADLTAVTVRIRIADAAGRSTGSGTIIDARGGEALILTCGHLFRESQGKAPIRVDLFGPQPVSDLPAELLDYDDRLDLGLITIRPPIPVVAARVAPPGFPLSQGDPVFTVGCNGGASPTVRRGTITALNRYLGPANIEASGAPVTGRSGGGLFSAEGFLIGVCNAADPQLDEGIYAALKEIHARLDRLELSFVYRGLPVDGVLASGASPAPSPSVAAVSAVRGDIPSVLELPPSESTGGGRPPSSQDPANAGADLAATSPSGQAPDRERAAMLTVQNGMPLPIPLNDPPLQPVQGIERNREPGTTALVPPSRSPSLGWNNVALTRETPSGSRVAAAPAPTQPGLDGLTAKERAALEEIARRRAQGFEIVCVVRPTDDATEPSEVIVLRDASPAFLAALQSTASPASDRSATTNRQWDGTSARNDANSAPAGGSLAVTSGNRPTSATIVLPAVVLPGPAR